MYFSKLFLLFQNKKTWVTGRLLCKYSIRSLQFLYTEDNQFSKLYTKTSKSQMQAQNTFLLLGHTAIVTREVASSSCYNTVGGFVSVPFT